jgi:hypothetical protein
MTRRAFGTLALVVSTLALGVVVNAAGAQATARASSAVVLIVTDGFRWQELFTGADSVLISRKEGGVQDTARLRREYWRSTSDERRRTLLPFLWNTVAKQGTIWGNVAAGSDAHVTNGLKFSYPGYNEMLTGAPDPQIDKNGFGPNPNITVLEGLSKRAGFKNRVAAFGSWDVLANVFNRKRAGFPVHVAYDKPPGAKPGASERTIDRMYRTTTRPWDDGMSFDAFMETLVLDWVKTKKPRALFVGFGETDEWAHDKRYDLVLRSAHDVDAYIAELWSTMQAMPEYRGRVTFIITTDHGRGFGAEWTDHGKDVAGAEQVWIAMIGPGAPTLGEVKGAAAVTQSQIAATVAAMVGEDWRALSPKAAASLAPIRK